MSDEPIYSKTALVACLDILGFKERVENELTTKEECNKFKSDLEKCMNDSIDFYLSIFQPLEGFKEVFRGNYTIVIKEVFSDTIVLVFDLEKHKELCSKLFDIEKVGNHYFDNIISTFLNVIGIFTIKCGSRNIFLRGGIAIGDFYKSNNTLISNALIKAHILESRYANYARILVDKDVINYVDKDNEELLIEDYKDKEHNFYVLNTMLSSQSTDCIYYDPDFLKNINDCINKFSENKNLRKKYLYLKKLYAFNRNRTYSKKFKLPFLISIT